MSERVQLSPAELRQAIDEADADGRFVSPLARASLQAIEATATELALGVAADHMQRGRAIGSEVVEAFVGMSSSATGLADRIRNGEGRGEEDGREVGKLLADYEQQARRADAFEAAINAAVAIESTPLAFAERLYQAHPTVRPVVEL